MFLKLYIHLIKWIVLFAKHNQKPIILFRTLWFSIIRFRWDYLPRENQQRVNGEGEKVFKAPEYPGFTKFMEQGVHTEYITSVFPSESFPSWQTINTGLFLLSQRVLNFSFLKSCLWRYIFSQELVRTTHNFISNGHGNI